MLSQLRLLAIFQILLVCEPYAKRFMPQASTTASSPESHSLKRSMSAIGQHLLSTTASGQPRTRGHVIWTDEPSFKLGKQSWQIQVWQKVYEKYKWDYLASMFKSSRSSVMIWGALTVALKGPQVHIPPNQRKANDFIEVIYEGALEPYYHLHKNLKMLTLMEDGAPIHCNNILKLWQEACGMKKLEWLAQSPYLNPIENL